MPGGALNILPILLTHTTSGPVMLQLGFALTVTIFVQVEVQPFAAVTVRDSVKLPAAPAVTVTF